MKNIVFIPNIDLGNGRSNNYNYSINSWKQWCDKNNCELIVWEDLLLPAEEMKITWQRYYVLDILDSNEWVNKSVSQYGVEFFSKDNFPTWRYINGGFQIFNKSHKDYLKGLVEWFHKNKDRLNQVFGKWNSTDQTCINFYREEKELPMTILPGCYNLQDMSRKNLMYYHPQQWWTDELHFLKNGWIYHFNAIPQNEMGRDANYWIERTYKELYNV